MFDIEFFMKANEIYKGIKEGQVFTRECIHNKFEEFRNKKPVIYNLETTNACNMKCTMCPRTTMMTRPIETISEELFNRVADQLEPHPEALWDRWKDFVLREYDIPENMMSENNFFLYIIPKVIQLHGYGDPLLDPHMVSHIKFLHSKGLYSYFSCNPANIDLEKTVEMFESGLDYIKYSIESVDDTQHKEIRGNASNFSESFKKIEALLDIKKKGGYNTTIIITMLDLNRPEQTREFYLLKEMFKGKDVYIYLKSEDTQWYRKDFHKTDSVHWTEFCRHPWMSMTIKSNGEATQCMEDFSNEIILGDCREETLYNIWNGEKYAQFRVDHFLLKGHSRCLERCDSDLIGNLVGGNQW